LASVYFASDFHLKPDNPESRTREDTIVRWLDQVQSDMSALYLVGDVFDFWFDYKRVVPKGFMRILSKLLELRRLGIPIHFFTGNHDLWMNDYLTREMDIPIYREAIRTEIQGRKVYIGHGDGLGPGDHGYKMMKRVFANPMAQKCFRWLHPDLGVALAQSLSSKSREAQDAVQRFLGPDKEWLVQFSEDLVSREQELDYLIFGHRHLPINYLLSNQHSRYVNLGDWIHFRSFARMRNGELELLFYENDDAVVYP